MKTTELHHHSRRYYNQLSLDIDHLNLECEFNNVDHRTELNGVDRLIVRRGQPFTISVYLRSGSYQPGVSSLDCVAETGPQPSEQYGTKASFALSANIDTSCWSASVTGPPGDMVVLSICSSPNAPIGRYTLTLGRSVRTEFILLFNPWCPGDAVYMDNEQSLAEYILAQDGIIFRGSYKHPIPTAWNFGQFEHGILDICLRILDMNPKCLRNPGKDYSGRRNAVYVSRVLSAMVNCNDDKGVLLGRWTTDYEGGVSPLYWRGSVEILRNWDQQACQPVRYGQCWVFAAVACTVSRALGIPCRIVTNYLSAHDTNNNLVIERYVNEEGELMKSKEMIWNYHCWVESWMTRPDLKPDFNGWQASDPTPQEKSEDVYCCGPIPVKAIKEGELTFKYDASFVFAEVNADVLTYMKKKDGSTSNVTSATLVGQKISTKSVGSDAREDITHIYKYPEGKEFCQALLSLQILQIKTLSVCVLQILGEPKENRKLAAEITLQNPLPEPLEDCCFSIEGSNLTGGRVITERLGCTVGPGEEAKVKIYFTPTHSGLRKLVVDFDSNKLCHVKGYRNVIIGK
uniref:Protein-glutamine gamma-glutamyltransferase 2 n=1 Tax=Nothobranchius furzeri TaxID=105023 RepID=A0A8C6M6W6_NOTFU